LGIAVKGQEKTNSLAFLSVTNDYFDFTSPSDRYFSNQISFSLLNPRIGEFFIYQGLLGFKDGDNIEGFNLVHDIYTANDVYSTEIIEGDRPFASGLILEFYRHSISANKGVRLTNEFGIGVLGPMAGGRQVQDFIHSLLPNSFDVPGWDHQIGNDVIIQYSLSADKAIVIRGPFTAGITGTFNLGTFKTNIDGGIEIQVGNFLNYYSKALYYENNRKFSWRLALGLSGEFHAYDATLQGGIFNGSSPYTIQKELLNRSRFRIQIDAEIKYNRWILKWQWAAADHEFDGTYNHQWGQVGIGHLF
jgi:hypothetical protein